MPEICDSSLPLIDAYKFIKSADKQNATLAIWDEIMKTYTVKTRLKVNTISEHTLAKVNHLLAAILLDRYKPEQNLLRLNTFVVVLSCLQVGD